MKRVSVDEEARVRNKHQGLLQDYLELQKEFVSKKKKLQTAKQKKDTLMAEVRFLRRRHRYLLEIQSDKLEPHGDLVQSQYSYRQPIENRNYGVKEVVLKNPPPLPSLKPIVGGEEGYEGRKEKVIVETLRVEKKPKNCLINEKRVGKKKISWQDQVAMEV